MDIVTVQITNITMVQGDTLAIGVEIEGITDDLDTSYFSCKSYLSQENYTFQVSLGDGIEKVGYTEDSVFYEVRIPPEMTEDLEAGKYFYDWDIGLDDDVFTIMRGCLYIEEAVTRRAE